MKYLIVPEFHKDGALHFHALIANYNGRLKDSKKRQNGRVIYNMTGYRAGFTTAVPIDNNKVAVSNYIKKIHYKRHATYLWPKKILGLTKSNQANQNSKRFQ